MISLLWGQIAFNFPLKHFPRWFRTCLLITFHIIFVHLFSCYNGIIVKKKKIHVARVTRLENEYYEYCFLYKKLNSFWVNFRCNISATQFCMNTVSAFFSLRYMPPLSYFLVVVLSIFSWTYSFLHWLFKMGIFSFIWYISSSVHSWN